MHRELIRKLETISSRERCLLFCTLLALSYFLWESLILDNLMVLKQQQDQQILTIKKVLPGLAKQLQEVNKLALANQYNELYAQENKLKTENITIEKAIENATKQLISAEQMTSVLADIIAANSHLKIIKIENFAAEPILGKQQKSSNATEANKEKTSDLLNELQVYKHGLVIEFKATYFDTRQFLRKLEELPWKLMFDELNYEVTNYPEATIKLTLYTLSLQKVWLGM